MTKPSHLFSLIIPVLMFLWMPATPAFAQTEIAPCPRLPAGSEAHNPPSLVSHHGMLSVNFSYQTTVDADGRTLFCFMTPDGAENPTLHVLPGDTLIVNVTNNVPDSGGMSMSMSADKPACGADKMTSASVNIHYHGLNLSPVCHQDEVIQTTINTGQTFQYKITFPNDEPPGLYWYHPHIHGMAEAAVQGGASGAIVVDGIEKIQPEVQGLNERILMIRDQNVANHPNPGGIIPSWDLTLNTIPIAYPHFTPAIIKMPTGKRELWRVCNASADSLVDLQVLYDNIPQNLQIVGLDGVPTGSQDGSLRGNLVNANHILLPTAGRAEFILAAPPAHVKSATFITRTVMTGPDGDNDTRRILANIQTANSLTQDSDGIMRHVEVLPMMQRFEWLATAPVTAERELYFSEVLTDPSNPNSPTNFYITVNGNTPTLFDPANGPAITTTQGAVEDWTIENRTLENHEFHIHQIHFLVMAQNHFESNGSQSQPNINGQFLDTIQIPYWDGNPKHPYPSVKIRLDFRGPDIGDFVYHCHILGHEDNGMMAIIRVIPKPVWSKQGFWR